MDKEILEILKRLEIRQNETYQIVKALEHSAEINKVEHDNMTNDIPHIKGNVEAIRKDISNVEIITSSNWNDISKLKSVK